MFLDFYKLKMQPFGVTPDPRFLYLGQSHREALASLYYGIESDRGFVALIAPPGLGKTTLTFQLLEKLQQASRSVFVFQTQCNSKELFHYLLNGLGVDAEGMELVSMHNKLNQILCREMLAGRRFVLAIDEAQNLDPEVLETIRLLSNFETSRDKMLQILLIGQPQLAKKLLSPQLEQLQQRISVFAKLEPFGSGEIADYIGHRLGVAGHMGSPLFTPSAIRLIAEHSLGIPRKINSLCFSALSLGCAMQRKLIDGAILEEVIADRDVESLLRSSVARRATPPPAASSPAMNSPIITPPIVSAPVALPPTLPAYSMPSSALSLSLTPSPLPSAQAGPRPALPLRATPGSASSSAVSPRPASFTYPEKPRRSFGPWAMGAAGIAAVLAVGIGLFILTPGSLGRVIPESSFAWGSIQHASAAVRSFIALKSRSVPSSLNVQAAELPGDESESSFSVSRELQIHTVVVQPGETLHQIILETGGENSAGAIEQIEKLNPSIADFGHLQAGQTIQLPQASSAVDSGASGEMPSASGKN